MLHQLGPSGAHDWVWKLHFQGCCSSENGPEALAHQSEYITCVTTATAMLKPCPCTQAPAGGSSTCILINGLKRWAVKAAS